MSILFFKLNFLFFLAGSLVGFAQQDTNHFELTPQIGLFPKEEAPSLYRLSISGFYRFFATETRNFLPYIVNTSANTTVPKNQLFIGDDSQLPTLQLNVSGRPTLKTSWAFDVYTYQYLNGDLGSTYGNQVLDSLRPNAQNPLLGTRLAPSLILNLGINFTGTHETTFGNFTIRAGGIQWVTMSDLTMGSFRGYNRFTLFERNPWDPVANNVSSRYESYFNEGAIEQDLRWGNRAFKGFILEGTKLPAGLEAKVIVGKSELNGGFSAVPNITYGGRIKKISTADRYFTLNGINSITYSDSLALQKVGFSQYTIEYHDVFAGISLHIEGGVGNYFNPLISGNWGEVISATITTPMFKNYPRVSIHGFRINPNVINNNAVFVNTAVQEYATNTIPAGTIGSNAVLIPVASSMLRMGQMANNRQGIDLNLEQTWKQLSYNIGLGATAEIKAISNQITFTHPVNSLVRSRFWRFAYPANVGPYDRYSVVFRDVYETVNLSDDSLGIAVNPKFFSIFEPQIKYKTKVFDRPLYLFFLGAYSSAQQKWSAIPLLTEKAYIRQYSSELEAISTFQKISYCRDIMDMREHLAITKLI